MVFSQVAQRPLSTWGTQRREGAKELGNLAQHLLYVTYAHHAQLIPLIFPTYQ